MVGQLAVGQDLAGELTDQRSELGDAVRVGAEQRPPGPLAPQPLLGFLASLDDRQHGGDVGRLERRAFGLQLGERLGHVEQAVEAGEPE